MKACQLLLIFLLVTVSLFSVAQEIGCPIISNYNPKEMANGTQVRCAVQDNRGIMYFGASDVIEYDGVTWRTISSEKLILAYDLAKDKNGKIYVGAIDEFGYLELDKKGTTIYKSLIHLIKEKSFKIGIVRSVNITSHYIYFQSQFAIFQYSPIDRNLIILKPDKDDILNGGFVFGDTFYTISKTKGLQKIVNNQLVDCLQSKSFKQYDFRRAILFNDSSVLIQSPTKGLFLFQPDKSRNLQEFQLKDNYFITDNRIDRVYKSNNNFILGSLSKGAVMVNAKGEILQQYNESTNLQSNEILKINSDFNNNIWLSLNNGICKTEPGLDLSFWNKYRGLKDPVLSIKRYKGVLYIGTSTTAYYIDTNNEIQSVKNIAKGQIWCFYETKNSLLAGTANGIFEIKGDSAIQIFNGSYATCIYQSLANPSRLISTDDEFLISFKHINNKWIFEGRWEGITDDIRHVIEDVNGDIWLGTFTNGPIRITPNEQIITAPKKIWHYKASDGVSSYINFIPYPFKNQILWGGKKGLTKYNPISNRFEPFSGLGEEFCNRSNDVAFFKEMPDGKIWISPINNQRYDTGYLQPNSKGGYDWIFAPFSRIPDMSVMAMYIEPDNIAWFGGSEGLYRYDISKDTKDYSQKFNCLIRKATVGQDSALNIGPDNEKNYAELAYKFNSIKFDFAAAFFDNEERTLYRYKLEGFDKEWSEWSRQTKKEYTNLSKGTYTFKVKAKNIYDVESDISTYLFEILPPWHRSWWAYTSYFILLILLFLLIVKIYTGRLMAQKNHLEEVVRQRTFTIKEQKEKLELANATKDKFFKIIAHDLRSPFNGLVGFSELLIEEIEQKDYEKSHEYAEYLQRSANELLSLTTNLLNWSRSQTNDITFSPESLNLKFLIDNNINLLGNLAEKKGIILTSTLENDLFIFADSNMVLTILRNLINNAIKFSRKDDRITIKIEESENEVIVHVSDTGVGIDDNTIDKLFKVGENVKSVGTAQEPGTGLGLILCKEFVDKHNGKIWVESKERVGSRFSFTLPKIVK